MGGALLWLSVVSTDAAFTPRFTISPARIRRSIAVYQFRPDAGETVSTDGVNVGLGTSTTTNSGNITTTGTDEVVVGGHSHANGGSFSTIQIGGVAVDGSFAPAGQGFAVISYRILTAVLTAGAATAVQGASDNWVGSILAFKSAAAGGGPTLWAQSLM